MRNVGSVQEVIVADTLGRLGKSCSSALNGYRNLTLEISLDATNKLSRMESPTLVADSRVASEHDQQRGSPEVIHTEWINLGVTFDLTYSWMRRLAPELRELEECNDESHAVKLGELLSPLLRKDRDLCHHIRWVYDELGFDGTYGGQYIESINIFPKPTGKCSLELVRKWVPELEISVGLVFTTYSNAADEFIRALNDPDYGKRTGVPSNFSMAEVVIRKTKTRIYDLALVLNDIYKGAGYDEPFAMIAKHDSGEESASDTR